MRHEFIWSPTFYTEIRLSFWEFFLTELPEFDLVNFRWANKIAFNVKHNVSTTGQPIRARRCNAKDATLYGAIEFTSMSKPKYGFTKYAVTYGFKYGACHGKYGTDKSHAK